MTCGYCGAEMTPRQGRGRPRTYCSQTCRWRAGARGAWPSRVCSKQRCTRPVNHPDPDGFCPTHRRLALDSQPKWTMQDELLDWLSVEGTWSTALEAAERFDRNLESTERALRKLREKGLVKSRIVELARVADGGYDKRIEWRTA